MKRRIKSIAAVLVLRMVNPKVMEIRLRSKLKSVLIVHYLKILYNGIVI